MSYHVFAKPVSGNDLAYAAGGSYTDVLYVSPNGNNSDGTSWTNAYTTLQGALGAASTNVNRVTMIAIAPGTYDINTTGDPTYTCNVDIIGSHRNNTIIRNDHASATSVLKFSSLASLQNVMIDCGSGTNNGIIFNSTGCRLNHVYVECENVTGAQAGVIITGTTKYLRIMDTFVHGVVANTTGILHSGASYCYYDNIRLFQCLKGVHLDTTGDDYNYFHHALFHDCATAITVDSGANNNTFVNIKMTGNTTNIADAGTSTSFDNIYHDKNYFQTYPSNSAGVVLSTGDGSWVLTAAWSDIVTSNQITKPFYVTGAYVNTMTVGDMYELNLAYDATGGADTQFCSTKIKGSDDRSATAVTGIDSGLIPANSAISAKISSDSAGIDNMTVWIQYITV